MRIQYHLFVTFMLTLFVACMGGQDMVEQPRAEATTPSSELVYLPQITLTAGAIATPATPMPATPTPMPTATPMPTPPPTNPRPAWGEVGSWAYQLTGYPQGRLDEIGQSNFELVVIDLARDGYTGYFSAEEITAVQNSQKYVLAYFEIGAIESYRPEWDQVPPDLMLGPVSGWEEEQYVKYWDDRWWPIVQGRLDQALAAGFDGAYFDMIVTYEELPANAAGTNRTDLARKMVALIERASQYAKSINPNFKIVPQNSPELGVAGYLGAGYTQADANRYLAAIDGLGVEELHYLATDKGCTYSWCADNRANTAVIRSANKLILAVDYANKRDNITDAYHRAREAGFVPYASVRDLDILRVNPGLDP
jgi:cysteinyl-tRNA synthetase, unknown class